MINVLGAGGHGQVVASALRQLDLDYQFWDGEVITEFEIGEFIVAIGDNGIRSKIFLDSPGSPVTIIHYQAFIPASVMIGLGTFVGAGVIANTDAIIGNNCIINTGSIIEHHVEVMDHAHVAPGAVILGGAVIGEGCLIGANATVLPNSFVPDWSTVRAGSLYGHRQDN